MHSKDSIYYANMSIEEYITHNKNVFEDNNLYFEELGHNFAIDHRRGDDILVNLVYSFEYKEDSIV